MIHVDIVLPVYNPHVGWESIVVSRYREVVASIDSDIRCHPIIVNDGSTMDISESLDFLSKHIPDLQIISYQENKGKGYAIREGLKHSFSPYALFTDHDFPYQSQNTVDMIHVCVRKSLDLVIAQRDASYYENIKRERNYISKILKLMNKKLLRLPVQDTQGGLKMFSAEVREVFLSTTTNRYLIDIELLKKADRAGFVITPMVVNLRKDVKLTHVSNIKIGKELIDYIKIWFS